MAYNPTSITFGDLPKQTNGNFMTALSEGLGGVGDVMEKRDEKAKKAKTEALNDQFREVQTKSVNQQIDIGNMQVSDANALKNLGSYQKYDDFIKDNPLTSVTNIRSAQEFYDSYNQKQDTDTSQGILNTLKASNGGKLPTKEALIEQLPTLIADKGLSNKATGMIFQALDTQEANDLAKLKDKAAINHYGVSDAVAIQNANSQELLHKAQAAAALAKEPKSALAKEEATYYELVKSGEIDPKVIPFGSWLSQSGGKVTLKSESITNARNQAREQLTGISNIVNSRIAGYDPSKHGIIDGAVQGMQEFMPFLKTGSAAELQSSQEGYQANVAKAMFGGKATNQQLELAKGIAGGTINTESGAAAQLKSSLNQSILATEETIRQIESSKGDASDIKAELTKYKKLYDNLQGWDGSTPTTKFLDQNYEKNIPKEGTVISLRNGTVATETNATPQVPPRQVVRTGIDPVSKRKIVVYSDGSVAYAD